jgi:hypothetical protein
MGNLQNLSEAKQKFKVTKYEQVDYLTYYNVDD